MPRTEEEPLERQHFWIYERDVARLNVLFGRGSGNKAGKSLAVRRMIRKFLDQIEAKAGVADRRPGSIVHDRELTDAIEQSVDSGEPKLTG